MAPRWETWARTWSLVGAVLAVVGCNPKESDTGGGDASGGPDRGEAFDAALDAARASDDADATVADAPLEAGDASRAPDRADAGASNDAADAPSDAPADAGDASDGACIETPQADDPGRAVEFVLTNTSSSQRYLIVQGNDCLPFGVDAYNLAPGPLRGPVVSCEGVDAGPTADLMMLAPDASYTFAWQALYAVPYTSLVPVFCNGPALPMTGCEPLTFRAMKNVPPGSHTASFFVADVAPSGCSSGTTGCRAANEGLCYVSVADGGALTPVRVTFDLPDAGPDAGPVQVPVPIP